MEKKVIILSLIILAVSMGNLISDDAKEEKKPPVSFKEFVSHLDLTKNTSLHVEHFWEMNKGKSFIWTAKVVDVKGGRGKAEILAANDEAQVFKGYNLVLVTHLKGDAAALKVGQQIKFRGLTYNYKGHRGNPIIVYMNNVEFLPLDKK